MDNKPYSKKERDARSKLHRIKISTNFHTRQNPKWKFDYNNGAWSCPLQTMRCMHQITPNKRCKRETTYTAVYCWQHLKSVAKLRIGPTTMQDSKGYTFNFMGLFVCDTKKAPNTIIFRKNDIITSYIGEILDNSKTNDNDDGELEQRYPGNETAPYVALSTVAHKYIDAACLRSVGSFSNACLGENKNCKKNATFSAGSATTYPHLKATTNIRNGQEVFVSYGTAYFAKKSIHRDFVTKPDREYKSKNYKC